MTRKFPFAIVAICGLAIMCSSIAGAAPKKYTKNKFNAVILGTHKVVYSKAHRDTIEVEDQVDHAVIKKIVVTDPQPEKIDGKKVVINSGEGAEFGGNGSGTLYLYKELKNELCLLNDGYYILRIYNILVDDKGQTCMFTYDPPGSSKKPEFYEWSHEVPVDSAVNAKIFARACEVMDHLPKWKPATKNGKKIVGEGRLASSTDKFKIEAHKLYIIAGGGWQELQ